MITKSKEYTDKEIQYTVEPRKMRLSNNAAAKVFQMFTKNVYSNPIGTVVREIVSNCFDSHVEACVNYPVIIKKSIDANDVMYISFIDYGVGMSEERIYDIYGVYFETTKDETDELIGGYGIGGKTPFAYMRYNENKIDYDNSFYVITNYNNVKYTYLMMEGLESPEIALLHTEFTTDRNGTEVRIPILKKDLKSFKKEIVKQLYYFENIIFEGFEIPETEYPDEHDKIINADYQIVRGKSFLFRGKDCNDYVHVCLGRVAYPIDFSVLNLNSSDFSIPIALRFDIGELNVTLSRESLDYSKEDKNNLIKSRLIEAMSEIKELLVKQYSSIDNLEDYFKVRNNYGKLNMPNGLTIDVSNVIKEKEVGFKKFRYSELILPNDRKLFHLFFDLNLYGKKPIKSRSYNKKSDDAQTLFGTHDEPGGYEHLMKRNNLYSFEGDFNKTALKQAYLKTKHSIRFYAISKKDIVLNRFKISQDIYEFFGVVDDVCDANGNPTEYMQTLLDLREEYWQIVKRQCPDYNALVVPEEYIASRKALRTGSRQTITDDIRNTTIPLKFVDWCSNYRVKLDTLFNTDVPIYYGTRDDDSLLKLAVKMYEVFYNSKNIVTGYEERYDSFRSDSYNGVMFITISQGNIKYMKHCKNAMHVSKLNEELQWKEYQVTEYFQVRKFINEYHELHDLFRAPEFSKLSPYWANKIAEVTDYLNRFNANKIDLGQYYRELSYFFNLKDIELTYQQQRFVDVINEGLEMQEMNKDVTKYLELYQNYSNVDESFWKLLKKVLVF